MSTPASVWSKTDALSDAHLREFAAEVRADLSKPQKELHSKYLYDELGSALFEAITRLPEYGLTRADETAASLACGGTLRELMPEPAAVIELGSGTGEKTRHILSALSSAAPRCDYVPIDVSPKALARCRARPGGCRRSAAAGAVLSGWNGQRRSEALRRRSRCWCCFSAAPSEISSAGARWIFCRLCARSLRPGDALLIGADLVKDRDQMLRAYDDAIGLTAAFNLNLLGRINRELGGNFDLRNFQHEARWNEAGAAHRDASALARGADGFHRGSRFHGSIPRRRDHLDRIFAQVSDRGAMRDGRADWLSRPGAVGGPGVAVRRELVGGALTPAAGVRGR